jgi:DNA-directed RNA polymerase subunit F
MLSNVKKLNLDLKETELLSIANLIPTKIVELHVCIDDIENRLKDTDITNLLDVIKQSLNIKDDEDNEDNMDES